MSKELDEMRGKIVDLLYEAVDKVIMVEPSRDEETFENTMGLWLNIFADRFLSLETSTCRIAIVSKDYKKEVQSETLQTYFQNKV